MCPYLGMTVISIIWLPVSRRDTVRNAARLAVYVATTTIEENIHVPNTTRAEIHRGVTSHP